MCWVGPTIVGRVGGTTNNRNGYLWGHQSQKQLWTNLCHASKKRVPCIEVAISLEAHVKDTWLTYNNIVLADVGTDESIVIMATCVRHHLPFQQVWHGDVCMYSYTSLTYHSALCICQEKMYYKVGASFIYNLGSRNLGSKPSPILSDTTQVKQLFILKSHSNNSQVCYKAPKYYIHVVKIKFLHLDIT